jgi:hypothetical protein
MKSDHADTEPCDLILYELVGEVLARGEHQQEIERLHPKLLQRRAENPVEAQRDHLTDPVDLYVSERGRNARWTAFEDHLRRNRVDITATCRSCGTAKDKVALPRLIHPLRRSRATASPRFLFRGLKGQSREGVMRMMARPTCFSTRRLYRVCRGLGKAG